jgi:hypothetical protein
VLDRNRITHEDNLFITFYRNWDLKGSNLRSTKILTKWNCWVNALNFCWALKDESSREKVVIFIEIRKIHEKWSIFCFYGIYWIANGFEIIAWEVDEIWNLCITTKTCTWVAMNSFFLNQYNLYIEKKLIQIPFLKSMYYN